MVDVKVKICIAAAKTEKERVREKEKARDQDCRLQEEYTQIPQSQEYRWISYTHILC